MRQTPLIDIHRSLGASIGEFAGIKTALDFGNVIEEHLSVRQSVGIFDISHMCRIIVEGSDSQKLIDYLVARDVIAPSPGTMIGPTAFLNEKAGFKDDVMVYKLSENRWLIVGNAVNREKDFMWVREWSSKIAPSTIVRDATEELAMIAIQGPKSPEIMEIIGLGDALDLKPLNFRTSLKFGGKEVFLVSRSGWTGEDGFEIIARPSVVAEIFKKAIENGARPCGLIARDTLRIEMGFVLYGNDIDEETTPLEARYWVYTLDKDKYIGKEALLSKLEKGVEKIRVGIRMKKGIRIIPRSGCEIRVLNKCIGKVTSGTYSPYLNRSIAMGYVDSGHALIGLEVKVVVRGKEYVGKIVDFPFVKR